jgi:DNA-directed RNA polymerase subunit RPC12/RpoP
MGSGMMVKCSSCGREEEFMLGVGMLYSSLEAVLDRAVHWRRRSAIREILDTYSPVETDYGHRLYACPKCETLHERFYVSIRKDETCLYDSQFKCSRCKSALVPTDKDASAFRCRKCHQRTLTAEGHVMWD